MKGLPFTVHIYIGPRAPSSKAFRTHAGSVYNFSAPSHTAKGSCSNCSRQEDAGAKSTGQVPITSTLLRHVIDPTKPLESLNPHQVAKYLTANLHWRITTVRPITPPFFFTPLTSVIDGRKPSPARLDAVAESVRSGRHGCASSGARSALPLLRLRAAVFRHGAGPRKARVGHQLRLFRGAGIRIGALAPFAHSMWIKIGISRCCY